MSEITMENKSFQAIADRVKNSGRADEYGTRHLGHWSYRVEDGGYTEVIVNTDIGVAYYRNWKNEITRENLGIYA